MKTIIKNIIIGIVGLAILVFVYYYFIGNKKDTAGTITSSSSGVVGMGENSKIVEDTQFLSTLIGLSAIKIDTALFSNKSFISLTDNTVSIGSVGITGRPNPFAPIEDKSVPADTTVGASGNQLNASTTDGAATPPATNTTNTILNRLLTPGTTKK